MAKNIKINCPLCDERYKTLEGLYEHIEEDHEDNIPKDYSVEQYVYFARTGKSHGNCIICKRRTGWNDATSKYHRFCTNPKCKETYREQFKQRMVGKYGKTSLMDEPDHQRKMLANRHISGIYEWSDGKEKSYTGTYELDFLKFLDVFLNFDSDDVMSPSPHTYYYIYNGEKKFYIPDVFIPSLGLEIEIKDGGNNPNMHHKIQDVDKMKERLKDEVMVSQKEINYIKIVNKEYGPFIDYLNKEKDKFINDTAKNKNNIKPVNEMYEYYDSLFEFKYIGDPIDDNIDIVEESTGDIDTGKHPVYIMLMHSGSPLATAIKYVSNGDYSHSSISFDSSMKEMYTFGAKVDGALDIPEGFGFTKEDITRPWFSDKSFPFAVYVVFVNKSELYKMKKRLEYFVKNRGKFIYNTIGLFKNLVGVPDRNEYRYFCSQFVTEILNSGRKIADEPSLIRPSDFTKMEQTHFVTSGILKEYNKKIVDKIVKQLRPKV